MVSLQLQMQMMHGQLYMRMDWLYSVLCTGVSTIEGHSRRVAVRGVRETSCNEGKLVQRLAHLLRRARTQYGALEPRLGLSRRSSVGEVGLSKDGVQPCTHLRARHARDQRSEQLSQIRDDTARTLGAGTEKERPKNSRPVHIQQAFGRLLQWRREACVRK